MGRRNGFGCALALSLALVSGCGGPGARDIVSPRHLSGASGKPSIGAISDMGIAGPLVDKLPKLDSDGVFVVGELILIEGSDLGKQPTVLIGGRPAERIARTGNGGIITRIPRGVPTGQIEVEIAHRRGRGTKMIEVRRYGLVTQPGAGTVFVFAVSAKGSPTLHGTLKVRGARSVAFSRDGTAAYVVADGKNGTSGLAVIAMTAGGGPRLSHTVPLPLAGARSVKVAREASVAVVSSKDKLVLVSVGSSQAPSVDSSWAPRLGLGTIADVEISPSGKVLAVTVGEGNRVIPIDITDKSAPKQGETGRLLPQERVPLLVDAAFSPAGDELWIISGDNPTSVAAGLHPTRLVVTQISGGAVTLTRVVPIAGAGAPLSLAVARRESILGGTAIRTTAKKAAIVIAGVDAKLLAQGGRSSMPPLAELGDAEELGHVLRTDLDGGATPLWSTSGVMSSVEISQDVKWAAAALLRAKRTTSSVSYDFGVVIAPVSGGKAKFLRLGDVAAGVGVLAPASVALAP